MKKIFINITYIVLSIMSLTYLFVPCAFTAADESAQGIIAATAHTGLPIMGLLLLFPLVILTIVALTTNNIKVTFARDVITFFASIFILVSTIITFCICAMENFYVPIIILVCVCVLLGTSTYAVIKTIKEDELTKKDATVAPVETAEVPVEATEAPAENAEETKAE